MKAVKVFGFLMLSLSTFPINAQNPQGCDEREKERHDLTPPPSESGSSQPKWGWLIKGSSGELSFCKKQQGGSFAANIRLSGLEHDTTYTLTLNNRDLGDKSCISKVSNVQKQKKGEQEEFYLDFKEVKTDSYGNLSQNISVTLPICSYDLKFFVKAPSHNYAPVLYNDFLSFKIEN